MRGWRPLGAREEREGGWDWSRGMHHGCLRPPCQREGQFSHGKQGNRNTHLAANVDKHGQSRVLRRQVSHARDFHLPELRFSLDEQLLQMYVMYSLRRSHACSTPLAILSKRLHVPVCTFRHACMILLTFLSVWLSVADARVLSVRSLAGFMPRDTIWCRPISRVGVFWGTASLEEEAHSCPHCR